MEKDLEKLINKLSETNNECRFEYCESMVQIGYEQEQFYYKIVQMGKEHSKVIYFIDEYGMVFEPTNTFVPGRECIDHIRSLI